MLKTINNKVYLRVPETGLWCEGCAVEYGRELCCTLSLAHADRCVDNIWIEITEAEDAKKF
jgi:hypothetical protein